ncbi:hypothetical protein Tco_0340500 [Tanacetum coccineum]|uniref:Uncharacterized protein n=1 Tax=Tanacetum coccineum TaxID=301880 RepID=A0ABQ5H6Y6_9ASTR
MGAERHSVGTRRTTMSRPTPPPPSPLHVKTEQWKAGARDDEKVERSERRMGRAERGRQTEWKIKKNHEGRGKGSEKDKSGSTGVKTGDKKKRAHRGRKRQDMKCRKVSGYSGKGAAGERERTHRWARRKTEGKRKREAENEEEKRGKDAVTGEEDNDARTDVSNAPHGVEQDTRDGGASREQNYAQTQAHTRSERAEVEGSGHYRSRTREWERRRRDTTRVDKGRDGRRQGREKEEQEKEKKVRQGRRSRVKPAGNRKDGRWDATHEQTLDVRHNVKKRNRKRKDSRGGKKKKGNGRRRAAEGNSIPSGRVRSDKHTEARENGGVTLGTKGERYRQTREITRHKSNPRSSEKEGHGKESMTERRRRQTETTKRVRGPETSQKGRERREKRSSNVEKPEIGTSVIQEGTRRRNKRHKGGTDDEDCPSRAERTQTKSDGQRKRKRERHYEERTPRESGAPRSTPGMSGERGAKRKEGKKVRASKDTQSRERYADEKKAQLGTRQQDAEHDQKREKARDARNAREKNTRHEHDKGTERSQRDGRSRQKVAGRQEAATAPRGEEDWKRQASRSETRRGGTPAIGVVRAGVKTRKGEGSESRRKVGAEGQPGKNGEKRGPDREKETVETSRREEHRDKRKKRTRAVDENGASTREEVAKDDHRHTEAKDSPDEEQTERCNGSRKTPEMAIERSPAGAATDARQHREEERTNNQRAVRDATGREGAKQTERQTEEAQEASGQHKRNRSGETGRGTDGVPSRREIASNRCEESKKSTHRPATSSIREEGEDTAERTKKGRVARGGSAAATEREGKTRKQRDKRQSKERRRQTITEGREVRIREGVNEHQGGEIAEEWRSSEGAEQERAEFQGTRVDRGREGRTEAQGDRGRDVTATTQGKEGERGEKQRQRNEGQRRTTKRGRRRQEKLGSEQEDEQRQQREKGGRARAGQKEQETKQRENSGQPEEDKEVGTCDGRRTRRDDEDEYREEKKKSRGRADIGTAQRQKQKSRKKAKAKRHTGGGRQYGTKTTRAKRDRKREVGREVEADEEKSLEEHPPRVKRDNKRQDRGSKALRDGRRSDENE